METCEGESEVLMRHDQNDQFFDPYSILDLCV